MQLSFKLWDITRVDYTTYVRFVSRGNIIMLGIICYGMRSRWIFLFPFSDRNYYSRLGIAAYYLRQYPDIVHYNVSTTAQDINMSFGVPKFLYLYSFDRYAVGGRETSLLQQ